MGEDGALEGFGGVPTPTEEWLMGRDLDRVHDLLDAVGAPEDRSTMCASDRLSMITGRLIDLVEACNDYIAAANCYDPENCTGDHSSPAKALSTIARLTWEHQEAIEEHEAEA